jgi:electron transport complex protein RnfD
MKELTISTSPQIHSKDSTAKIMWTVSAALAPASLWSVYMYGLTGIITLIISIASAVFFEWLMLRYMQRGSLKDGSAFLTGLLIGMNLPPSIPLYIPIAASAFAIIVIKFSFGGLGGNWMNPALAGRAFVFFSWSQEMVQWTNPSLRLDAVSSATPLGVVKTAMSEGISGMSGPLEVLTNAGYFVTDLAQSTADFFSNTFLAVIDPYVWDLFFGSIPGSLGESSALLLLVGAAYLFYKKIITWHIPIVYTGVFALLIWVFGGIPFNTGLFSGNILFHLFSGGLVLGAFYMASDMVTSPVTKQGQIIYASAIALLTFLIRVFGGYPEAVSLAILFMNIFVPAINRYIQPKRFGEIREAA